MTTEVRKATPKDIPYILEMYGMGLKELGETGVESLMLRKVVNSFHLAPCFLLVICGKIRGMAGYTVVTSSHSGDAMLSDYMFYVYPEDRNIKHLGALVEAAKAFADEVSLPLYVNFIINGDEDLRKRVLSLHGFEAKYVTGAYNG